MSVETQKEGAATEPDFTLAPRKRDGLRDKPEDIPDYIVETPSPYNLYMSDRVIIGVRQHVRKDPEREAGGVLLGRQYQRGAITVVSVTGFVPLPSGSASAVHFDFDENALLALHRRPGVAGEYVVGWFHSHPNMGDPFMSSYDINLHRQYFKKPWHVSCVVAVGEWSLPLGFWRLDGTTLITIEEHYVHMTVAEPPADQFRRFLRACNAEDRSLGELFTRVHPILGDLGFDDRGPLSRALEAAAENEAATQEVRSEVGRPMIALASLAKDIAENPEALSEMKVVEERLRLARFEEDALLKVITADAIPERIAALGDACYALTPGTADVQALDFISNSFLRVHLKAEPQLVDVAAWTDGSIWLLDAVGQLARLPNTAVDDIAETVRESGIIYLQLLAPCKISGAAEELWMAGRSMLIRTSEQLHHFELPAPEEITRGMQLEPSAQSPLPCANCVIMEGWNEAGPALLGMEGDQIFAADGAGRTTVSAPVPRHWRGWKLTAACRCALGIYALLDDGAAGQLVLLDEATLEPLAYYLHRVGRKRAKIHSISVALDGRVFVHKGATVYLVAETGSPSPTWYRYRTLEKLLK